MADVGPNGLPIAKFEAGSFVPDQPPPPPPAAGPPPVGQRPVPQVWGGPPPPTVPQPGPEPVPAGMLPVPGQPAGPAQPPAPGGPAAAPAPPAPGSSAPPPTGPLPAATSNELTQAAPPAAPAPGDTAPAGPAAQLPTPDTAAAAAAAAPAATTPDASPPLSYIFRPGQTLNPRVIQRQQPPPQPRAPVPPQVGVLKPRATQRRAGTMPVAHPDPYGFGAARAANPAPPPVAAAAAAPQAPPQAPPRSAWPAGAIAPVKPGTRDGPFYGPNGQVLGFARSGYLFQQ